MMLPIAEIQAHGGRTNSQGCHNDRKRGDYHCHNSGYKKVKAKKKYKKKSISSRQVSSKKKPHYNSAYMNLVRETQKNLKRLGYEIGDLDGVMGAKTRNAIKHFQRKEGLKVTGVPSQVLLKKLINSSL